MTESKFRGQIVANDIRNRLIDKGRDVSEIVFSRDRGRYVFTLHEETED